MSQIPSVELYRRLFFVRRCEEYIIKHYSEDQMRTPMHMSMGQEFIPVGICTGLEGRGDIFSSYRSHAAFLAQTMDSDMFFGELHGRVTGSAEGKGGSMHLSAPEKGHILSSGLVAGPISVAVGTGFANRRLQTGRTSVVFFGDGATDAGTFWESLNIASLYRVPMFFVCEDNGLAVHTFPQERRGYRSILGVAEQFRCHVFSDESNDVEEVYKLARKGLDAMAADPAPVFMNIRCCRYLEHIGITDDWHVGYRPKSEYDEWFAKDSLAVQRNRLIGLGMGEADVATLEDELDSRIRASVTTSAQAPKPGPDRLYHGVYHEKA